MISREKAAEYAKLLQAFSEGKEVQQRWIGPRGTQRQEWEPWDQQLPDDEYDECWQFRIKPEARKARTYYIHRADADMHYKRSVGVRTGYPAEDLVIVREVLPENAE